MLHHIRVCREKSAARCGVLRIPSAFWRIFESLCFLTLSPFIFCLSVTPFMYAMLKLGEYFILSLCFVHSLQLIFVRILASLYSKSSHVLSGSWAFLHPSAVTCFAILIFSLSSSSGEHMWKKLRSCLICRELHKDVPHSTCVRFPNPVRAIYVPVIKFHIKLALDERLYNAGSVLSWGFRDAGNL